MTKIILAGATGLVGGNLAPMLALDGHEVHLVGRSVATGLPENVIQHVQDTSKWSAVVGEIGAQVAISCLGTTMKQAGSKLAFKAVDFDLIVNFACAARQSGAERFIAISSVGASCQSRNFYLRTKGETERAISALGFDRVDFLRPGLLRGDRVGPLRAGETIASTLSPVTDLLMVGGLSRYRSISARMVAKAIATLLRHTEPGCFIHENRGIEALAG